MRKTLILCPVTYALLFVCASARMLSAQQNVPPPPKPADAAHDTSGPSLEVTLQFIADKINEIGTVNFVYFGQNATTGVSFSGTTAATFSQARADLAKCQISYHEVFIANGDTQSKDLSIAMHEVNDLRVIPAEQFFTEDAARNGHPELIMTSTSPPVTMVDIRPLHNAESRDFIFYDAALADRFAKSINHAVELCGGGSKDPF